MKLAASTRREIQYKTYISDIAYLKTCQNDTIL